MKTIIIVLLGIVSLSWAQDLGSLEKQYTENLSHLRHSQMLASSQQKRLAGLETQIDSMKKAHILDDKLLLLLNKALQAGNILMTRQKNVDSLGNQAVQLRRQLYNIYTNQIDSLNGHLDAQQQRKLVELLKKRRSVAPALRLFSFDQALIAKKDADSIATPLDTLIRNDYLRHALLEVDANLGVIKTRKTDLHQQQILYREMAAFGNEMQEDTDWGSPTSSNNRLAEADAMADSKVRMDIARANGAPAGLGINERFSILDDIPPDSLSGEAYMQMLDQAEKYLDELREKINNRLGHR